MWSVLIWTALSFNLSTAALQYTAAELLRLRFHLPDTSPALHLFLDIARDPRRKYIHRGSRRRFYIDDSKPIQSIWSSIRQHPRNSAWRVDHSVLASLARSANVSAEHTHGHTDVNFGLFNIRSLTTKGPLLQDLLTDRKFDFLCLTETWQQPNDFPQLDESTPPGSVYICQPRATGRGGGL